MRELEPAKAALESQLEQLEAEAAAARRRQKSERRREPNRLEGSRANGVATPDAVRSMAPGATQDPTVANAPPLKVFRVEKSKKIGRVQLVGRSEPKFES